ncbi:hypothetical protein [Hoeflea alexandrii]|uniref:hypothetical protein n=1 Tax=Hoeflea alexandrii TaxID=288436 RepID=UPI0022AF7643|nr:hypothetical protein [Hoeflea alexandrii]
MAAAKRKLSHAFRISRKLALLSGGFLFVLGASGTAALVFAPANMIPGFKEETRGHCKTVYQSEFRRGKEKRLIAVISGDDLEPRERVKTGLRVARHLSETVNSDLVIVQVADHRGPTARAQLRGAAIGAEIVYAPVPTKSLAVTQPWEVRFVNTLPASTGYYFGERVDMPQSDIEAIIHEIEKVEGCDGDVVEEEAKTASAAGHGEPAKAGHGEPAKPAGH